MKGKNTILSKTIIKSYFVIYTISFSFLSMNVSAKEIRKAIRDAQGTGNSIDQNFEMESLIYLSQERLDKEKIFINNKDPFFTEAYQKLIN